MTKQLVKKTLLHTTYSMDCQKRRIWLFLTTIWLSLTAVVCNILSVLVVNATPSRIWYRQDCTKTAISGAKYDSFDDPDCTYSISASWSLSRCWPLQLWPFVLQICQVKSLTRETIYLFLFKSKKELFSKTRIQKFPKI